MKNYILTYDVADAAFGNSQVLAFIRSSKHIDSWYQPFSGTILIKTDTYGTVLQKSLAEFMGDTSYVLSQVLDVERIGGLLPDEGWNWLEQSDLPALTSNKSADS